MLNRIILFPNRLGQKLHGVEKSPIRIKQFLSNNNDFHHINCRQRDTNMNLIKNLKKLYTINSRIHIPKVNIGGDHSMSIATVADSLNKYPKLKVLWFDAHADINTRKSSYSNNYHGMPLSFLTGLDYHKNLNFIKENLEMHRIMYIGLRDLDIYESKIIINNNINRISVNDIRFNNTGSINKILNFVGNDPIHLSFDVDVMDPSVICSTGTAVNDGLYFDETKRILDMLINKRIVNMDITELNLDIGNNNERFMSLNNTLNLFENYIR